MRALESLSVWCLLLEIFRHIIDTIRYENAQIRLLFGFFVEYFWK
jgi:hypothetical protein